jgi:Uma2 family endonuclease
MIASQSQDYVSPEAYLAAEAESTVKHEYIRGYVYAMAGASDAHVTIALNLASAIRSHVRQTGCRVFIADMRVRVESRNVYYYPDVLVTCDERDRTSTTFKRYPCLIVEVLSDQTEAFDRGDKFADYQSIETLQEYVLINQKRQRVECFRRNEEGWMLRSYTSGSEIHLASVDFSISIEALYEDVELTDDRPLNSAENGK